jgi:hypothetical protein
MLRKFVLVGCIGFIAHTNLNAQQLGLPTSVSSNSGAMVSRSPDTRAWTDPALNHNRLIQQRTEGNYVLVGPYKVTGSPFLFGEHHKADMYATEAKAYNIFVSYNTYNQQVEFYSTANPDKPLVKEPGEVDSFILHADPGNDINSELKFIYGPHLGSKDKCYLQEICKGNRYTLYKRYKSDLGYSSSNIGQSDLRQFDLLVEYYYYDIANKSLKKIKPNQSSVIKEFKDVKDLSNDITVDEFSVNPEAAFCRAFSILNQQVKGF